MAVGDAFVFPVLIQLFFPKPSHRLLFSLASAEVRGENMPQRKVASTGDRTHNHQVMSPTRSPLSHLGVLDFVYTLASTNIDHSAPNLVRMYMTIRSQMCLIMDLIVPELS